MMNKYLLIIVLVALAGGVFYLTRDEAAPGMKEEKTVSTSTSEYAPQNNASVVQVNEKNQEVSHSVATVSGGGQQAKPTSIAIQQTQNAIDFNAAGAGTAQQKATAAAAATKAYHEATQH